MFDSSFKPVLSFTAMCGAVFAMLLFMQPQNLRGADAPVLITAMNG